MPQMMPETCPICCQFSQFWIIFRFFLTIFTILTMLTIFDNFDTFLICSTMLTICDNFYICSYFFYFFKSFFTILISNFARRCKAMQEGKNLRNAITMRGGSGRVVVPWCQVAGSPAAAAAVPAKVAEVASNWSSSSQLVCWPGHRRSWACHDARGLPVRRGTEPSPACAARASQ